MGRPVPVRVRPSAPFFLYFVEFQVLASLDDAPCAGCVCYFCPTGKCYLTISLINLTASNIISSNEEKGGEKGDHNKHV